jgi:hypothetical protein
MGSSSSSTQQSTSHRRDVKVDFNYFIMFPHRLFQHSSSTRHRTDDELMDTGAEVYSGPFANEITVVPQHSASATASSSSTSNRELLSKKEINKSEEIFTFFL